ncbi:MAG: response regulator [Chloroflexota bacterium]
MAKNNNSIDGALILIVEDHVPLLRDIGFILQVAGFDVISASNGTEALDMMRHQIPDLVVSDIEMPNMSGYDLLRQMRNEKKLAAVPCIFMSGEDDYDHLMTALDLGAADYLPKPFDAYELIDAIHMALTDFVPYKRAG